MAGNYLKMSKYSGSQTNNQMVSQNNVNKAQGLSELAGVLGGYMDYRTQRRMLGFANVKAKEIEVNALEQANQLRESFAQSLGNSQVEVARRGFKQNSGSVRAEREYSSINMGEDIAKMKKNAKSQATAIKAEANIKKHALKSNFFNSMVVGGVKAGASFASGGAGGGA